MTDEAILKKIGLSKDDAEDLVEKHSRYLKSLNPEQYELVKKSLPSWEEAATALGHDVTAPDLLNFVRRRGGAANPDGALCICIAMPRPLLKK